MQLQLSLTLADRLHETLLVRGEPLDAMEAVRLLVASPNAPVALCDEILGVLVTHDRRFCWKEDGTGRGDGLCTRRVSLSRWELPDPRLADVPFVALDLETTGARPGTGKITEIGAVRLEGFREVRRFSTLVNPLRPIPSMITQITGITQEMVAGAPRIEEVLPSLLEFIEGAVIVAHNAPFDVGFLNYELCRLKGRRLGEGAIDTLPLARSLAPGLPNYRLRTVAEALEAPVAACHRALADAQAAGHVFVTLMGRLQERGVAKLGEALAYISPTSHGAIDKLRLTADLPDAPGTYRFMGREGDVLYVGRADHLREKVRSQFVPGDGRSRRLRRALRQVDRIEWDETYTPLEAVVRQQELILAHRPPCNLYGAQPDNYVYLRVGGAGRGLSMYISSRPPKWPLPPIGKNAVTTPSTSTRSPLVLGPFRGRTRLKAALDLLRHCYPVRHCPRRPDGRPCLRGEEGRCLAPCVGDAGTVLRHDALVMDIVHWLVELPGAGPLDPLEDARRLILSLSDQGQHEPAGDLREACDHLLGIRRSYRALVEAQGLCFAALWPEAAGSDTRRLRLNLVRNGRLYETLSLRSDGSGPELEAALGRMADGKAGESHTVGYLAPMSDRRFVAAPQHELDALLAVRRWFCEEAGAAAVRLPEMHGDAWLEAAKSLLLEKALERVSS